MKIQDIMTKEPFTTSPETSLKHAAQILVDKGVSGLPVVGAQGRVLGVLSEGDILFKELGLPREQSILERWFDVPDPDERKLGARTVAEAMSAPAVTIAPNRPVTEAANTMVDEGINRLPVVDDDGKLVGIITRADLVRAFIRSDATIATEIRDDIIRRTLWMSDDSIEVQVEKGEVRLSGQVETKADAEMIPAFVQRVPGVVSVLSKLRWPKENGHRTGARLAWHKQP